MREVHQCGNEKCKSTITVIDHAQRQKHVFFQNRWFCDAECADGWLREYMQQEGGRYSTLDMQ